MFDLVYGGAFCSGDAALICNLARDRDTLTCAEPIYPAVEFEQGCRKVLKVDSITDAGIYPAVGFEPDCRWIRREVHLYREASQSQHLTLCIDGCRPDPELFELIIAIQCETGHLCAEGEVRDREIGQSGNLKDPPRIAVFQDDRAILHDI